MDIPMWVLISASLAAGVVIVWLHVSRQCALSDVDHWQTRWAVADERVDGVLAEKRRISKERDDALDLVDRVIEQRDAATTALNEWLKKADELKQELVEKIKQQEATDKVVTAYQVENAELKHALDGWKDSVQIWKDAASDNSRLNDALKLHVAQLEQQMAELGRRKDECQQQKADLELELQRVSDECGRWVVEYGRATTVIATQEKKIEDMHGENEKLNRQLDEKINRINELTVAQAPAPNQPTFITTDQCDEIRYGDRQYIDELKAAIQEMGQTIRKKDRDIASVQKAYSNQEATIRGLLTERSKLEQQNKQIEKARSLVIQLRDAFQLSVAPPVPYEEMTLDQDSQ